MINKMMEINEQAKKYAEGKALSAITEAIEKAYTEGFNEGFNEGYKQGQANGENPIEVVEGVEYVDLGLPSGTKWSKFCLRDEQDRIIHLPYDKASKLNIPTAEQYQELLDFCKETQHRSPRGVSDSKDMVGVNGNAITLFTSYIERGSNTFFTNYYTFWLKSEAFALNRLFAQGVDNKRTEERFAGDKLPVMLVR